MECMEVARLSPLWELDDVRTGSGPLKEKKRKIFPPLWELDDVRRE